MTFEQTYPLEGTALDVPLIDVLSATPKERHTYVHSLLAALDREADADEMSLKNKVSHDNILRDFSKVNRSATDLYLFRDDQTQNRNVLGCGSPGRTHTNWSRTNMWKMRTKIGCLPQQIKCRSPKLVNSLAGLFDPDCKTKNCFRSYEQSAVRNALKYMQMQTGAGSAFPPFHARYLADRYLPKNDDGIVVDPCAGWGGRLLGSLLVPREQKVSYVGIDPELRNKSAYEGLTQFVTGGMKEEVWGERTANFFYMPFEDWLSTPSAHALSGKVDLVMTSPPYYSAELYNPTNLDQSANRYPTYSQWHDSFLIPLIRGSYQLLKPGGHFVLNIANVQNAPNLEDHTLKITNDSGFESIEQFRLALSLPPGNKDTNRNVRRLSVDGVSFKWEPVFCFKRPNLLVAANDNEPAAALAS